MAQRLGEILIGLGLVSAEQIDRALRLQKRNSGLRIGEELVVMGAIDQTEILRALARQQRVPFADPSLFLRIDPRLRKLVPKSKALHYALVPIRYIDGQLIVATCDADNIQRYEELVDALGHKLRLVFASRIDIQQALNDGYQISATAFGKKHKAVAAKKSAPHKTASRPPADSVSVSTQRAQIALDIIDQLPPDTGVFRLTNEALFDLGEDELPTSEHAFKRAGADDDLKTDRGPFKSLQQSDNMFANPVHDNLAIHDLATVYDKNLAQRVRADLRDDLQPLIPTPQKAQQRAQKKLQQAPPPAASAPPPPAAPPGAASTRPRRSRQSGGRDKPINRIPTGIRREKSETLVRPARAARKAEIPEAAALPSPRSSRPGPRAALDKVPRRQVQRKVQPPPLNQKFGDYLLLRKVATGGMAEVFEAQTTAVEGISRKVAIKRILPNLTDSREFVSMFVDEAKITVQLNHVNIGQVYELGRVDDAYFIAMEYIRGRDLNAILGDAYRHNFAIPVALATFVMQQVFEGLDYAHQKRDIKGHSLNIVHRDVSPANVLCSFEGQVKVIDFGIAKAVSKVSLTRPGLIKGKISYMSPEQMRGEKVDHRSDIFAAGIIFYELLSGQHLFGADSDVETIRNVLKGQIKPIRQVRPDIPDDLARVVERCLRRNPAERYDWASDVSQELQRVLIMNKFRHPRELLMRYMETRFGGLNTFEEA